MLSESFASFHPKPVEGNMETLGRRWKGFAVENDLEWSFTESLLMDQAARSFYWSDLLCVIHHLRPHPCAWTSSDV
jgi:hypothetical protein